MSTVKGAGPGRTLTIELEDAATRRGWVSTLGLLSGMMQQWHFVGLLGDEMRYESATLSAPYSWGNRPLGGTMLPRNEWAPGMNEGLDELRGEIAADGWAVAGHGEQATDLVWTKPVNTLALGWWPTTGPLGYGRCAGFLPQLFLGVAPGVLPRVVSIPRASSSVGRAADF